MYILVSNIVITDPFTRSDLDWLQTKLDARLAPTLSRIFGIPESSIRANDVSKTACFVVLWRNRITAITHIITCWLNKDVCGAI